MSTKKKDCVTISKEAYEALMRAEAVYRGDLAEMENMYKKFKADLEIQYAKKLRLNDACIVELRDQLLKCQTELLEIGNKLKLRTMEVDSLRDGVRRLKVELGYSRGREAKLRKGFFGWLAAWVNGVS